MKENTQLKGRITELTRLLGEKDYSPEVLAKLDVMREGEAVLLDEIETIAEAFEQVQSHNATLIKQLGIKEDANGRLFAEKHRLEQDLKELQGKLNAGSATGGSGSHGSTQSGAKYTPEYVTRLEKRERQSTDRAYGLEKELREKENTTERMKRKASEAIHVATDLQGQLDLTNKKYTEALNDVEEKRRQLTKLSDEHKRTEEDLHKAKLKLDSFYRSGTVSDKELLEELERYKSLAKCKACNVKFKEVALAKCMHTFCRDCIQIRLDTRQRKCPTCNEPFGQSDVRDIYL